MKKCFLILSGQYENYGDLMHRRGLIDILHKYEKIYALAPGNNRNFKNLIGDDRIVWIESTFQWLIKMFHFDNMKADIYFCSGEMNTSYSRVIKELCLLPPFHMRSIISRSCINRVGIGLGNIPPHLIGIWRFIFRFSDTIIYRTKKDFDLMKIGDGYAPDLAYLSSKNTLTKQISKKNQNRSKFSRR